MNPKEDAIRGNIRDYVRKTWKTDELWTLLEEFEDELENASKGTKDNENYSMVLLRIVGKSLVSIREIIVLCEAGYSDGAFSIARTIYELCIHILFFLVHENDQEFDDYITDYLLNGRYQIYKYNKERTCCFDDVDDETLQSELDYIKSNSKHTFPDDRPNDYWWTGKNSFWGMVDDIKRILRSSEDVDILNQLHLFYTATNRTIHANAAGNAQRLGKEYESHVINTAPNIDGQGYPLYFSTMSMIIILLYICDKYHMNREKYHKKLNNLLYFYKSQGAITNGGKEESENPYQSK